MLIASQEVYPFEDQGDIMTDLSGHDAGRYHIPGFHV